MNIQTEPIPTRTTSDLTFCRTILPEVSRTFALSIELLPSSLRDAVRCAYLLCRIVDTIEDERHLDSHHRRRLFDLFETCLTNGALDVAPFEALSQTSALGEEATRTLCCNAGAVFRSFRTLSTEQQKAISPSVLTMSKGMRDYVARAEARGVLRLSDLSDLERYCYFVAGTVGELLTALFLSHTTIANPENERALKERSIPFGLGLQLVNIVKDIAFDFTCGDCYLPESLAAEYGVSLDELLHPAQRDNALAIVRIVCNRAREHLERAKEYTLLWPERDGKDIRLFCAVPLLLALATLREVEDGHDTLEPGKTPKVSREFVGHTLNLTRAAIGSNALLAELFTQYST